MTSTTKGRGRCASSTFFGTIRRRAAPKIGARPKLPQAPAARTPRPCSNAARSSAPSFREVPPARVVHGNDRFRAENPCRRRQPSRVSSAPSNRSGNRAAPVNSTATPSPPNRSATCSTPQPGVVPADIIGRSAAVGANPVTCAADRFAPLRPVPGGNAEGVPPSGRGRSNLVPGRPAPAPQGLPVWFGPGWPLPAGPAAAQSRVSRAEPLGVVSVTGTQRYSRPDRSRLSACGACARAAPRPPGPGRQGPQGGRRQLHQRRAIRSRIVAGRPSGPSAAAAASSRIAVVHQPPECAPSPLR